MLCMFVHEEGYECDDDEAANESENESEHTNDNEENVITIEDIAPG